jgi:putative thioredoxin
MSENPFVRSVTETDFEQSVLEASFQLPVLVDFWADWCQPCRVLMPMLARLAEEYGGKFILAKVNTEENRSLAAALGIRSLPTVRLFMEGEVVDEFLGALPESQVRAFLDKHIPNDSDLTVAEGEMLLEQGDITGATALISQAATADPSHLGIRLLQAKLAFATGKTAQAQEILASFDDKERADPRATALITHLAFDTHLNGSPSPEQLQARLIQNENDSEACYLLALHAVQLQDYALALSLLLELMRKDRQFNDDAARKTLLEVFNLLGGSGELVSQYRNKMFTLLH